MLTAGARRRDGVILRTSDAGKLAWMPGRDRLSRGKKAVPLGGALVCQCQQEEAVVSPVSSCTSHYGRSTLGISWGLPSMCAHPNRQ